MHVRRPSMKRSRGTYVPVYVHTYVRMCVRVTCHTQQCILCDMEYMVHVVRRTVCTYVCLHACTYVRTYTWQCMYEESLLALCTTYVCVCVLNT